MMAGEIVAVIYVIRGEMAVDPEKGEEDCKEERKGGEGEEEDSAEAGEHGGILPRGGTYPQICTDYTDCFWRAGNVVAAATVRCAGGGDGSTDLHGFSPIFCEECKPGPSLTLRVLFCGFGGGLVEGGEEGGGDVVEVEFLEEGFLVEIDAGFGDAGAGFFAVGGVEAGDHQQEGVGGGVVEGGAEAGGGGPYKLGIVEVFKDGSEDLG